MRDHLTYADLAGHRHLRRYVIAAALILIFVSLLFGWAGWQRVSAWAEISTAEAPTKGETVWLATGSKQEISNVPTPATGDCPQRPEVWELLDVYPEDNYKRIEPDCVYAGLAKTVAWHMLERSGYTKTEAAALLGFLMLPWQPTQSIKGLTNMKGPVAIPLDMEWAPHLDYRTWMVNAIGQPALVYSLRGCYRTRTIVGNDVEAWGRYPVICVIAYDRDPGWVVSELREQHFTIDLTTAPTLRRFAVLGYAGNMWVLLGESHDQQKTIREPALVGQEREQTTARYGTVPWDAAWLGATFGLRMNPLPDDWQTFGADPNTIQVIARELDDALQEFGGVP